MAERFFLVALTMVAAGSSLHAQLGSDSTGRPFATWRETLPSRGGAVIWTRNDGADTVLIASVRLDHCLNVAVGCGTTALGLRLAPGASAQVLTVKPLNWEGRYGYRLSWEWLIIAPESATAGDLPFDAWASNLPDRGGVLLWVRNTSPDPLVIARVHLTECSNLALGCGTTDLHLRLAPGDSTTVLTIKPKALAQPANYLVSWDWQPAGP